MKKSTILIVYLALVLFTAAPVLSVMAASTVAHAYGVRLDEGGVHPCIVLGHDIGPLLYDMFVAGWFMLVTIPVGVISIFGFTLTLIYARFRRNAA